MPNLASHKLCCGCMSCLDSCPTQAISIKKIGETTYPAINTELCIKCRKCEKSCPIINSPNRQHDISSINVYGGWCTDDKIRYNGASGGAFAAFANSFFDLYQDNAIVIGATLTDYNQVQHIAIHNRKDIHLLQNSKYIQSQTAGIYKQTLQYLKEKKHVLFSGLPCQIASLYSYLGNIPISSRLITIELVCHGIANQEALNLHLKYHQSDKIYSFRDKKEGQYGYASQRTTIAIKNIPIKIESKKDIFYAIYTGGLLMRKSCSNCLFSRLPRIADITLADFWGYRAQNDEYQKGISLILSNNQTGDEFVKESSKWLYTFPSTLEIAINGNPNIYTGYNYIQYHPLAKYPQFFKSILPDSLRLSILTNKIPWKLLWGFYKVATIIHKKQDKKKILKQLTQ